MKSYVIIALVVLTGLSFQFNLSERSLEKGIWASPESLYDALQLSQLRSVEKIKNDSIRIQSSLLVKQKWDADTINLKALTRELWFLHKAEKCSDSLLLLESPSRGEVDFTRYIIVDLVKRNKILIHVSVDTKTSIKEKIDITPADSIIAVNFNPVAMTCGNCPIAPFADELCIYVHGSIVESSICFGQNNKDYGWLLHLYLGRKPD